MFCPTPRCISPAWPAGCRHLAPPRRRADVRPRGPGPSVRRCQLESVTSWTWILVIALSLYTLRFAAPYDSPRRWPGFVSGGSLRERARVRSPSSGDEHSCSPLSALDITLRASHLVQVPGPPLRILKVLGPSYRTTDSIPVLHKQAGKQPRGHAICNKML